MKEQSGEDEARPLTTWRLRPEPLVGTCDGCAEMHPLPYVEVDTEAWLCQECWKEAIVPDLLRLALMSACSDGWADGEGAMRMYLRDALTTMEKSLHG